MILNISSASGMYPVPLLTIYSATKASTHECKFLCFFFCTVVFAICVLSYGSLTDMVFNICFRPLWTFSPVESILSTRARASSSR